MNNESMLLVVLQSGCRPNK